MRILLIAPPTRRILLNISGVYAMPPLGLAYIAAVLKKYGFLVDILDMPASGLRAEELPSYIARGAYSVCGISCNIFNLQDGLEVSCIIKRQDPHILVILGGRCTNFPSELIFSYGTGIDIIARGEGEMLMLELCRRLANSSPLYDIPNISYRNDEDIIENNSNGFGLDLDSLPFPARGLLPNDRYRIHPPFNIRSPITLIETSRGCTYECIFCGLPERLRERSPDSVVEEIEHVEREFGIKEIYFTDPNFTYNKKRIIELCDKILKKEIKIFWSCKTRVDLVDKDLLNMMSRAGCYMISYGVESGSQEILDTLNKQTSVDDIRKAFSLTRKERIRTLAYILIASPGESGTTIRQTMDLLRKIRPDFVLFGEFLPDPKSVLVQTAVLDGKTTQEELFDFYVFNKEIFGQVNLCGINRSQIRHWLNVSTNLRKSNGIGLIVGNWLSITFAFVSNILFYFRPCYFLDRIKDLRNFQDFTNMVQGVYFMARDKYISKKKRQMNAIYQDIDR